MLVLSSRRWSTLKFYCVTKWDTTTTEFIIFLAQYRSSIALRACCYLSIGRNNITDVQCRPWTSQIPATFWCCSWRWFPKERALAILAMSTRYSQIVFRSLVIATLCHTISCSATDVFELERRHLNLSFITFSFILRFCQQRWYFDTPVLVWYAYRCEIYRRTAGPYMKLPESNYVVYDIIRSISYFYA